MQKSEGMSSISPTTNGADGSRHVIEFHDVAFSVKTKTDPNKVRRRRTSGAPGAAGTTNDARRVAWAAR